MNGAPEQQAGYKTSKQIRRLIPSYIISLSLDLGL